MRKRPVVCGKLLSRVIIRMLKGHGAAYGVDPATWEYHRSSGLEHTDLFRVFKPFYKDKELYLRAVRHLKTIGLLSCNDPCRLWGEVLLSVNNGLAKHGRMLTLCDPSAEEIEQWLAQKNAEAATWQETRGDLLAVGEIIEPDVSAEVVLPEGLRNFPVCFKQQ
jgi:hypothetical protein